MYCFVNSLTALSAELEGRHYGGGVLELVPSEIEKLLVVVPARIKANLQKLNRLITAGIDPDVLLSQQDDIVLTAAGVTLRDRKTIQSAWRRIRMRRQRLEASSLEEPESLYA